MSLSKTIIEYEYIQLLQYLREEIKNKENHKDVIQICEFNCRKYTTLQLPIKLYQSEEVILKSMDIGRK